MNQHQKYILYILAISSAALYLFLFPEGGETAFNSHCLFRRVTGFPCPGCGTGRGLLLLLKGDFLNAWWMNPFSYLLFFAGIFLPGWIMRDLIQKKRSLEFFLQKPWPLKIQMSMFSLLGINWIWNFLKFC